MTRDEAVLQLERSYREERKARARERDERVAKLRRLDPEIARLQNALSAAAMETAAKVLGDGKNAERYAGALRVEIQKNRAEIARRTAALGLPEDYADLRYGCALCRDTGYAGEVVKTRCACFEKRLTQLLCEGARSESLHAFEDFDGSVYPSERQRDEALGAFQICRRYADSFPKNEKPCLLLMGESGLGKTFLLDAVARRVAERGFSALRLTAFRMLEQMRKYHTGQSAEEDGFERMLNAPLLLIDDLGTEPMFRNITVEYLFLLLNERLPAGRHTVIATNLSFLQLKERYGERVLSRLIDRSGSAILRLSGEDLRLRRS